jgi:hypothetical protein
VSGAQWSPARLRELAQAMEHPAHTGMVFVSEHRKAADALRAFASVVSYPHQDGDFTVLGPEVFASADGSVICWRGENYYRADAIDAGRNG